MNTQHHLKWIKYFERNSQNRPEPIWDSFFKMNETKRNALVRSFAEYQLGDGGGPCQLIARDAQQYAASAESTKRVTDLWFLEEAEHSRLLSHAVKRLNGQLITDTFAFRMFKKVRKLIDAQFEMLVLLQVEIISTVYYRMIRKYCGDKPIEDMCRLILRDEAGHIAYHLDRLTGDYPQGWNLWQRFFFYFLGACCSLTLWLGHGKLLRTIGMTNTEFFLACYRGLRSFFRSFVRRNRNQSLGC